MGMFDWFVGDLECPVCGNVCRDTLSGIQTKLRREPRMAPLRPGDRIVINHGACEELLCFKRPTNKDTLSVMYMWTCPNCDAPCLWGRVSIVDSVVREITNVALCDESIQNSNYISNECQSFGWFVGPGTIEYDER